MGRLSEACRDLHNHTQCKVGMCTTNRIKQPDRRTQRLEASRPAAHQSKLDLGLVSVRMVGAYSTSVSQSTPAATMPTPLRISPAHAFGCTPSVKALGFQFSNSPAGKSCEPEPACLGAPQNEPEPKVVVRSTAVIRLYAHEVADLARSLILAQTAIAIEVARRLCSASDGMRLTMQRGTERQFERA